MKKKSFSLIAVIVMACAMTLTLTACAGEKAKTATVYGRVHYHYQGVATVTMKGNKVTAAKFDETLLPCDWAKITSAKDVALNTEIEYVMSSTNASGVTSGYAKYVRVDNAYFEATAEQKIDKKTYPVYTKVGDAEYSLDAKVTTDKAQAKWYNEAAMADKIKLCVKSDTAAEGFTKAGDLYFKDATVVVPTKSGTFNKADPNSTYWRKDKDGNVYPNNGWLGNIKAMCDFVVANGIDFTETDLVKGDKIWKVKDKEVTDGTVSATVTDFKDYMLLLKAAGVAAKAM